MARAQVVEAGATRRGGLRPPRTVAGRSALLLVLIAAVVLAGCGGGWEPEQARVWLQERGERVVAADLEHALARLDRVLASGDALFGSGASLEARFAALHDLRQEQGVDGVIWKGLRDAEAWSGRTLAPLPDPPPPPWGDSVAGPRFSFHDGPYLSALVGGPVGAQAGTLSAAVLLEERTPATRGRPFAARWLDPLGLREVRILAPETQGGVPVHAPDGTVAFQLVVEPLGVDAVRDRLAQRGRRQAGRWGLLAWVLAVAGAGLLLRRRGRGTAAVPLGAALIALLARAALTLIDIPSALPALAPAFDVSAFGIEDPLGWLASPGDFLLTAAAGLVAALGLRRAAQALGASRSLEVRLGVVAVGLATAAMLAVGWVRIARLAVLQGRTRFFEAPSVVPPPATGVLLVALVAITAAAWLLTDAALGATRTVALRRKGWREQLFPALAAAAAAVLIGRDLGPAWALALLPLSTLLAHVPARAGAPPDTSAGRALLLACLSTALLFPLLWGLVAERRKNDLETLVEGMLRAEATGLGSLRFDLELLSEDDTLRDALREAEQGPLPEGIAFYVWRRMFVAQPDENGIVEVLDTRGAVLDRFTLTPLPPRWVPAAALPTTGAGDLQVVAARGESGGIRSIVGRLRVRDATGTPLGGVVVTVPDRVDLAVMGLFDVARARSEEAALDQGAAPLQFAVLRDGRVEKASDPSLSRRRGGFGPPTLAALGAGNRHERWSRDRWEGYAAWSEDRGEVVAVRRPAAGLSDAVLALARVVVVGVGLGALIALVWFALRRHRFQARLHHRILLSYFLISFVPILVLGWASAREIRTRHDAYLTDRVEGDLRRARGDLEAMGRQVFDRASDARLTTWAEQRHHDVLLYRDGAVYSASRPGLVEAEILPARLPPDAFVATVLDRRELVRREASLAGEPVWFAYAPVLDAGGRTLATVAVPLLYAGDRVEEQLAVTGSVLVAAYLLTLVMVLVGGLWAARRITRPIGLLAEGTRRVGAGELDVELDEARDDEIGDLLRAFNTMTRQLQAATARAAQAEREMAWRRMARQVAHEIKNPLTPMRLMIQQLQADIERDPENAEAAVRRTAAVVLQQIETLGRIAGNFANFARLPKRQMREVDVGPLVEGVVALHGGSAAEGVEVRAEVVPPLPKIRWDEEELRRILVNLVGNAVQAIPGSGHVRVRAEHEIRGGRDGVRIEVVDDGVGIAEADLTRLFEPDFSTKTGGTGLGLAIVRGALDAMGGEVDVQSTLGEGSRFVLWWPAA